MELNFEENTIIKELEKAGKYADLMIEEKTGTRIRVENGMVKPREFLTRGIRLRAVNKGWGVVGNSIREYKDLTSKKIIELITRASSVSIAASKEVKMSPIDAIQERIELNVKIDPASVEIDKKISDMKEFEKEMKLDKVKTTTVGYGDIITKKTFLNSDGSIIYMEKSEVIVSQHAIAKENGNMQSASEVTGRTEGYEMVEEARTHGKRVSKKAVDLLKAVSPKAGKYNVIMDNTMTGTLAHEAVGHAAEADSVGSVLKGVIGKQIGSELISIYDDPTMKGEYGSYVFDDEGVKPKRTVIIDKGVVTEFMHTRETVDIEGPGHAGNARAEDYTSRPIVRMSNTVVESGDSSIEELFDVKDGIYVVRMMGGETEPSTGNFLFFANEGYLIENGEKKQLLKNITVKGNILDFLKNVDAVSKDSKSGTGVCGKGGQHMPVGDYAPHIRAKNVTVGGK